MGALLIVLLVVLLLNVIPAFAPPTWMVFSFLGFRYPERAGWAVALVGAIGATTGRLILAKMSRIVLRKRWLSDAARANIDTIKLELERRPKLTFGAFLFYAFTPLPSNYLFIAYGLTSMHFLRIGIPFFLGRFTSYAIWARGAAVISDKLDLDDGQALSYFSVYFVLTQFLLLAVVYAFARLDWQVLVQDRKWRWRTKS
jgi:membrane protein YqaA with SNARE-associated domain